MPHESGNIKHMVIDKAQITQQVSNIRGILIDAGVKNNKALVAAVRVYSEVTDGMKVCERKEGLLCSCSECGDCPIWMKETGMLAYGLFETDRD